MPSKHRPYRHNHAPFSSNGKQSHRKSTIQPDRCTDERNHQKQPSDNVEIQSLITGEMDVNNGNPPLVNKPNSSQDGDNTSIRFATIEAIKHQPVSLGSQLSSVLFEISLLLYQILAFYLQCCVIYQSNFYLIDRHLMVFIGIFIARRFLWKILRLTMFSEAQFFAGSFIIQLYRYLVLLVISLLICWIFAHLCFTLSKECLFLLIIPVAAYILVFGLGFEPQHQMTKRSNIHQRARIFSHNSNQCSSSDLDGENSMHIHDNNKLKQPIDTYYNYDSNDNNYSCRQIQLVRCTLDPYLVRHEVEVLHWDFIDRIKHSIANCIIAAYYIGYLPTKTAKTQIYFSVWHCFLYTILFCLNLFVAFLMQLFSLRYCDELHMAAIHLGQWKRIKSTDAKDALTWSSQITWPCGMTVIYGHNHYISIGIQNVAIPDSILHSIFYVLFNTPFKFLQWIIILHGLSLLYHLSLLLISPTLIQIVLLSILLLINYHTFFVLLRNYWITKALHNDKH